MRRGVVRADCIFLAPVTLLLLIGTTRAQAQTTNFQFNDLHFYWTNDIVLWSRQLSWPVPSCALGRKRTPLQVGRPDIIIAWTS